MSSLVPNLSLNSSAETDRMASDWIVSRALWSLALRNTKSSSGTQLSLAKWISISGSLVKLSTGASKSSPCSTVTLSEGMPGTVYISTDSLVSGSAGGLETVTGASDTLGRYLPG